MFTISRPPIKPPKEILEVCLRNILFDVVNAIIMYSVPGRIATKRSSTVLSLKLLSITRGRNVEAHCSEIDSLQNDEEGCTAGGRAVI